MFLKDSVGREEQLPLDPQSPSPEDFIQGEYVSGGEVTLRGKVSNPNDEEPHPPQRCATNEKDVDKSFSMLYKR